MPLSADQAEAMLQRRLKKHDVAIILLHWFNAATWILGVATGAALVASPYFRVAPELVHLAGRGHLRRPREPADASTSRSA